MNKIRLPGKIHTILLVCVILLNSGLIFSQQEDLNVMNRWIEWTNAENMLIRHLNTHAFALLDERDREISRLKTRADWVARQNKVQEILMEIVGPFPERTPLNARVTGIVKKDGYRIEKILYESMPGFHVTGCLYIPEGITGRRPAILNVIGHTGIAFRAEGYQRMILHMVQKGFVVFAIDPIGQGERCQYYDGEKGESLISISAPQHSYFGSQCLITGVSSGRYFIWDGIRAIDYLVSRGEVDSERIGVTGISGGGTLTSYISAFDSRVKASAPTCYLTGFRRLLESIGAQDAEQNFYHAVKHGITHADFIIAQAPTPTLIIATTRDFFSIQGARETYAEVKRVYESFGRGEDLQLVEDDAGHTLSSVNNEATVAFFQKYLDFPGDPSPGEIITLPPEELNVTPTGQLSGYLDGETVFSLNKIEAGKLITNIESSRRNIDNHLSGVKSSAIELSGYIAPAEDVKSVFRGRYQRDGYSVEMYALHGEGRYVIPLLLFVPQSRVKSPAVIYLHPNGKITDAAPGGKIEQLVKQGYVVAAADVLGVGETAPVRPLYSSTGIGPNFYISVLTGRSIVGVQAADAGRVVNFLKTRPDVDQNRIGAVAFDELGPALLHAAAMNQMISSIVLVGSPVSYRSIVMNRFYDRSYVNSAVAGALTKYDLPDLMGLIAPRKIAVVDLKDQLKGPASGKMLEKELSFPFSVYSQQNLPGNINVAAAPYDLGSILDWSFK
jgi:dienelactone hydrolase